MGLSATHRPPAVRLVRRRLRMSWKRTSLVGDLTLEDSMSLDSSADDVCVSIDLMTPLVNRSSASTRDSVLHTRKLKLSHSLKAALWSSRRFEAKELASDNQLSEKLSIAKGSISSMASCI